MKGQKGEEKTVFSVWQKWKKHVKVFVGIAWGIFAVIAIISACVSQWLGVLIACFGIMVFAILLSAFYLVLNYRRIELYSNRVMLLHEIMTDPSSHTVLYTEIESITINPADQKGEHVEGISFRGYLYGEVDTLCVYCKNGNKILFGLKNWGEEYYNALMYELLFKISKKTDV